MDKITVYCETCRHYTAEDDSACDYCHRKSMGWSISESEASFIVCKLSQPTAEEVIRKCAEAMVVCENCNSMYDCMVSGRIKNDCMNRAAEFLREKVMANGNLSL